MLSFRDLRTLDDVAKWVTGLNESWPQRSEVMQHISRRINNLPFPAPHVVELCAGPGLLAEMLLAQNPQISYTGLDFSELLLGVARNRMAAFNNRARLLWADLNTDDWLDQLTGDIHAIISMQSLHDLGDESKVNRIYGVAKTLLAPGGLFLNADLVVPPGRDNPNNPGRRSIPRHLELLKAQGYERVACAAQYGEFGCFVGYIPRK